MPAGGSAKISDRRETNLVQVDIDDVMTAPAVFGTITAFGGTPIVLVPRGGRYGIKLRIPIGCHAIVSRRGASVGVYKPGSYIRPWFYRVSHLVTTHHLPYHFNVKACPTKDNVLITLEVDFLLHVSEPETFVYSIGPENMEELLRATQAESVRSLVRNISVGEAYDLRGYESDDMLTTLNEKMNKYGIVVDQVTISNIQLPEDLAVSMQRETTYETKQVEQMKHQESELLIQQDSNQLKQLDMDRRNESIQVEEEAKKMLKSMEHEIHEMRARMDKVLAEILADELAEVKHIEATGELAVGKKQNELALMQSEVKTTTEVEVANIRANNEKEVTEMRATAMLAIARNNAKATDILAESEGAAAKNLVAKRQHEVNLRKIEAIGKLSENKSVVIAGQSGDSIMQMMMVRESAKVLGMSNR